MPVPCKYSIKEKTENDKTLMWYRREVRKTEKKVDVSLVRFGEAYALKVYEEGFIPLSDYKIQSSADGGTELCVTIKGVTNELELKASLTESKKSD